VDKKVLWDSWTLGFNDKQKAEVVTLIWRLLVTWHILWVCNFLVVVGMPSPMLRAEDLQQLTADVVELKAAYTLTTKIALLREMRIQKQLWCVTEDKRQKDILEVTLERLAQDYRNLTKTQEPTLRCEDV